MGRLFLASILLTNRDVAVDQRMRAEGMREGEMALPLTAEGQDKSPPPRIHPLHEVVHCILYSTLWMILCLMCLNFHT